MKCPQDKPSKYCRFTDLDDMRETRVVDMINSKFLVKYDTIIDGKQRSWSHELEDNDFTAITEIQWQKMRSIARKELLNQAP